MSLSEHLLGEGEPSGDLPPTRVLRAARLVLPDRSLVGDLVLHGGNIHTLAPAGKGQGEEIWDLDGYTVLPGLMDTHTHGGWGIDFYQHDAERILEAPEHYAKAGVTRFLITLTPGPEDELCERLREAAKACQQSRAFLGIHLEGPFLCADKRGALPEAGIYEYTPERFERLRTAANGYLRLMTYAPEAIPVGQLARIRTSGVVLSIGHTSADADVTEAAIASGVERATHLCNAMPCIHHREPGPIVPLLMAPQVRVEVIADGHHMDDRMLALILKLRGPEGVILVSDSMPLTGMGVSSGHFAGADVVSDGERATQEDGTLAGSVTPLFDAMKRTARALDLTPWQCSEMTATTPAVDLRIPNSGRLASNTCADLIVLDDESQLVATLRAGQRADQPDGAFLPAELERVQ